MQPRPCSLENRVSRRPFLLAQPLFFFGALQGERKKKFLICACVCLVRRAPSGALSRDGTWGETSVSGTLVLRAQLPCLDTVLVASVETQRRGSHSGACSSQSRSPRALLCPFEFRHMTAQPCGHNAAAIPASAHRRTGPGAGDDDREVLTLMSRRRAQQPCLSARPGVCGTGAETKFTDRRQLRKPGQGGTDSFLPGWAGFHLGPMGAAGTNRA